MAFDGIVTLCMANELKNNIVGGRVDKIFQPFQDEIVLNIRAFSKNMKLLVSAGSSASRIHFTLVQKENPATAPMFCMILRKHLQGSKILDVETFDFERIIAINFECMNELGDLSNKKLIVEIMGRYSNIILVNENNVIIDAIKHVDNSTSRIREIMPARQYLLPPPQDKYSPFDIDMDKVFDYSLYSPEQNIQKHLLDNIRGFSPLICTEICFRANCNKNTKLANMSAESTRAVKEELEKYIAEIKENIFHPCITLNNGIMHDFYCSDITCREKGNTFKTLSECIDTFYIDNYYLQNQKYKKGDLIKVINNNIERANKKISIHTQAIREANDADKLKLYGELLTANLYQLPKNVSSVKLLNYYNGEEVEIKMDPSLSAQQNMQRYYKKYNKAKTTLAYAKVQLEQAANDLMYFENVLQLLENCNTTQEIEEVRQELIDLNYIRQKKKKKGAKYSGVTKPLHFVSSDGLDIFVGKNNKQNDYLTLKSSNSNDIWLHTKDIPGSHVVIKKGIDEIPQNTIMEGAIIAAFHSKAGISSTVPVDYTEIRNVKKPNGAKPGMVIFEKNKTLFVTPDRELIEKLKK